MLLHFGTDFPVWQGAKPRTPNMNYLRHFRTKFYDLWLSQVAKGLSGIAFPDVIELTRKTNMIDGPIRTPYDIRFFKCLFGRDSVMVRSWSSDLPASGFPCDLMGFPSCNYFWLICPYSALTSQYPRYSDFLSVTSLIFSRDWVKKTPQLIPLIYLNLITWFDLDYRLIASDLGSWSQELRGLLMITNKWESKDGPRKERKRWRTTTTVDIWRCFVFGFSTIVMVQLGLHRVQINVVVSSAEPVHVIFKVNQSLDGVQLTRSQYACSPAETSSGFGDFWQCWPVIRSRPNRSDSQSCTFDCSEFNPTRSKSS